jgi:hypothetical protein
MSWIPGISQLKSAVQLVTGDVQGAIKTQEEFVQRCPGVSQVAAGAMLLTGQTELAKQTWHEGMHTISSVANSVPVVGHVKGVVHAAVGDEAGAKEAFASSNRTSG